MGATGYVLSSFHPQHYPESSREPVPFVLIDVLQRPEASSPYPAPLYKAAAAPAGLDHARLAAFPFVVARRSVHVGNAEELEDDELAGLGHAGDAFEVVFLEGHGEGDRIERIVRGEADSLQNERSSCTLRD